MKTYSNSMVLAAIFVTISVLMPKSYAADIQPSLGKKVVLLGKRDGVRFVIGEGTHNPNTDELELDIREYLAATDFDDDPLNMANPRSGQSIEQKMGSGKMYASIDQNLQEFILEQRNHRFISRWQTFKSQPSGSVLMMEESAGVQASQGTFGYEYQVQALSGIGRRVFIGADVFKNMVSIDGDTVGEPDMMSPDAFGLHMRIKLGSKKRVN